MVSDALWLDTDGMTKYSDKGYQVARSEDRLEYDQSIETVGCDKHHKLVYLASETQLVC